MRRSLLLTTAVAALALPTGLAQAQTTDFVATLSDGVLPDPTPFGLALVRLTDNPAPGGDVLVVRGLFRDLGSAYAASRIRGTTGGAPVVQNLAAGVAETGRNGGWGAAENAYGISEELTAAILAGGARIEITTEAVPDGSLGGRLIALPVLVDGTVDEAAYQPVATKLNTNAGFGPDIDATATRVYLSQEADIAVLGVTGRLNTASNDGIGLWTGALGGGIPAGTPLGGVPAAGHYLGAGGNTGFAADFPVLLAFALNPGGGTESVFADVVRYGGADAASATADYLGPTPQDGTVSIGPTDLAANDGTSFPPVPYTAFAFRNDGAATSGFEILLPLRDLGFPVPVGGAAAASPAARGGGAVSAAAFVVSATAFFSDVTVPGNVTTGNLGFNPNFATLAGGPFSASGGGFTALAEAPRGESALRLVGPNPTGARTRLVLTLAEAQTVRVDVVDALGRVVAVLHDGALSAGETPLTADAAALPAGVYAVRVSGAAVRATQRLTVVR